MSGSDALYLDTQGNPTLGVGICDRCKTKRALHEFASDPNVPGLMVCRDPSEGCRDVLDPYRLPTRGPDKMTLPFYRPDEPLTAPTPPDWSMQDG
jgi:hypothetical protein